MLEGTIATVPPQGGWKHPAQPGVPYDTTNVLFICGGAFVGLEESVGKRVGPGGAGFQSAESHHVDEQLFLRWDSVRMNVRLRSAVKKFSAVFLEPGSP